MIRRLTYLDYSNTKRRNITTMMNDVSCWLYACSSLEPGRRSADDDELLQPDY